MESSGWEGSKLNFLVATDGSEASHLGFQAVMETLLHSSDKLTVAHIFDEKKDFLPYDMKP